MSFFRTPILDSDRDGLSVAPPPAYNRKGELLPDKASEGKYLDMAVMKSRYVVFVDEELDVYEHPGSLRHFRMMIRFMPFKSDLNVILSAAHHMQLLDEYSFSFEQRQGLSSEFERGYWDVRYTTATEVLNIDAESEGRVPVHVTYEQRRRIWIEMFKALGYNVKWGNMVLNVKRK